MMTFYWYLGQCAECMYDSQWYRESFVLYILSIITLVDPNQEKSLFDNIENYILGNGILYLIYFQTLFMVRL